MSSASAHAIVGKPGCFLYGRAELTSAGADYEDEFYFCNQTGWGARLARPNTSNNVGGFESALFRWIAAFIEDGKTLGGSSRRRIRLQYPAYVIRS